MTAFFMRQFVLIVIKKSAKNEGKWLIFIIQFMESFLQRLFLLTFIQCLYDKRAYMTTKETL